MDSCGISKDKDKINELVIGDIGGVLMPTADQTKKQQREFKKLTGVWTGLELDALRATADRARGRDRPGVIVCAVGSEKARVCLEATRYGAQHLLIDGGLARKIVKLSENNWIP